MKVIRFGLAVLLVLAMVNTAEAAKKKYLSIATGGTGGVYYLIGAGVAKLMSKYAPDIEATSETTAAGAENTRLLGTKKTEVALIDETSLLETVKKTPGLKLEDFRAVFSGHPMFTHIFVPTESPIKDIPDFKGKKVGVGAPGSGNEIGAKIILEEYGLTYKDLKPLWLSFTEQVSAFKDRSTDVGFISAGVPTSSIMDLTTTVSVRFLPLPLDKLKSIESKHPAFFPSKLSANVYRGQTAEVSGMGSAGTITVHKDLDDTTAYWLCKVIAEHYKELAEIHPAGNFYTLDRVYEGIGIPFHPGAIKYLKEVGVWDKRPARFK
ncbi:MAG: TAXI family TRAP transporter solute-binding subunit [Thermodesulfobacteriota bacterium]|nr:TAXI family TRAP transporter solute-binding subunit [Thermodesulfobacteriota bacterium]